MKANLLFQNGDFDRSAPPPVNFDDLVQDLEFGQIFSIMSRGDDYTLETVKKVLMQSLKSPAQIKYRQEILKEVLAHEDTVRQLYQIVLETLQGVGKVSFLGIGYFSKQNPEITLHRALQQLKFLSDRLIQLYKFANTNSSKFNSQGFAYFYSQIMKELTQQYLDTINQHLRQLRFGDGVLISAALGEGNKGRDYRLHKHQIDKPSRIKKIFPHRHSANTIVIPDRDEAGFKALEELRGRGINAAANAVAKSADHILSYFENLRFELSFYLGCTNLYRALTEKAEPVCFPDPKPVGEGTFRIEGLYDASLSLRLKTKCVGNDVIADSRGLIVITGANRGGKSTFLRSVGLAQIMMQAGMFVPAVSYTADIVESVFTHFKREEDSEMKSGKLEEELARMKVIVDNISSNSMLLLNESFSSTNEKEGSEIARQIVKAMREDCIKIFFVTHFYDLASSFKRNNRSDAVFLRAERNEDGTRPFKLVDGEPLSTVFGSDIYQQVFGVKL